VGNGDGAWSATQDGSGRGRAQDAAGKPVAIVEDAPAAAQAVDGALIETARFVPTVYLYDNFPGGVGLSEPLWQRQAELVRRAHELVARCDCASGCPACVGPVLAIDEAKAEATPKQLALQVLALFEAAA